MLTPESNAGARRRAAAERFRPAQTKLLLVAETPPAALERYFYFDDVREHDSLFRYVAKMILGREVGRGDKGEALREIQAAGVFLIDVKPDPADPTPLAALAASLVNRCRDLEPERIVLIKVTVYDAVFRPLQRAGLPVVDRRIPFPGSGQQKRFEAEFGAALGTRPAIASENLGSEQGPSTPAPRPPTTPTLHAEISRILGEHNDWMTTEELAGIVNADGRYKKRDGSPVTSFQIHGRTRMYPKLFERSGARVRLRQSPMS